MGVKEENREEVKLRKRSLQRGEQEKKRMMEDGKKSREAAEGRNLERVEMKKGKEQKKSNE